MIFAVKILQCLGYCVAFA